MLWKANDLSLKGCVKIVGQIVGYVAVGLGINYKSEDYKMWK